jgi:hypothetical protein
LVNEVMGIGRGRIKLMTNGQLDARESSAFSLIVLIPVLVVGLCSMWLSFDGIVATGAWAMFSGFKVNLVPVVVDGSIVVFSLTAIWERSRGLSTWLSWMFVGVLTAMSALLNWAHVYITDEQAQRVIGSVLALIMPLLVWAVTHKIVGLIVRPPALSPEETHAEWRRQIAAEDVATRNAHDRRIADERIAAQRERFTYLLSLGKLKPGSPERQEQKEIIMSTYNRFERNKALAARELGVSRNVIAQVVDDPAEDHRALELDTSR